MNFIACLSPPSTFIQVLLDSQASGLEVSQQPRLQTTDTRCGDNDVYMLMTGCMGCWGWLLLQQGCHAGKPTHSRHAHDAAAAGDADGDGEGFVSDVYRHLLTPITLMSISK